MNDIRIRLERLEAAAATSDNGDGHGPRVIVEAAKKVLVENPEYVEQLRQQAAAEDTGKLFDSERN
jgi:hypothetical protein